MVRGRRWPWVLLTTLAAASVAAAIVVQLRENARTGLCPSTERAVGSMPHALVIDAYVARGEPAGEAFAAHLAKLLEAYVKAGHGQVSYRLLDGASENARRDAKEAGLAPKDARPSASVTGLVLRYAGERAVLPLSPERPQGLEFWITNKVREVRARAEHEPVRIGVLVGHREMKLAESNLTVQSRGNASIKSFLAEKFPFYAFVDVDLRGGAKEVEPALAGLV